MRLGWPDPHAEGVYRPPPRSPWPAVLKLLGVLLGCLVVYGSVELAREPPLPRPSSKARPDADLVDDALEITDDRVVQRVASGAGIYFARGGRFDAGFMLFSGGLDGWAFSSHLSLFEARDAAKVLDDYPDFYLCASSGASYAKSRLQTYAVVLRGPAVRAVIEAALEAHLEVEREKRGWIGLRMTGEHLEFLGLYTEAGQDLTDQLRAAHEKRYILIDSVELCDADDLEE